MPKISVSLFIDRTLYARGPVDILDSLLRVKERRTAGQVVGEVDSWIERGGIVYFSLKPYTNIRLVRLPNPNLYLSESDYEAVMLRQKAIERKELQPLRQAEHLAQKEEKGSVRFYIEKYGPVLLAVVAGTYLLGAYIKKRA